MVESEQVMRELSQLRRNIALFLISGLGRFAGEETQVGGWSKTTGNYQTELDDRGGDHHKGDGKTDSGPAKTADGGNQDYFMLDISVNWLCSGYADLQQS